MNPPKPKRDFFFGTSPDLPKIVEMSVSEIHPNPDQPRKTFDEEKLRELARSIERQGLLQPIIVQRREASDGGYLLVAGERRFRAFQRLNKATIPAIITEGNPDEIALIENIQREDLNPLEEAEALERMMERYHYTQEELGKVIGKAQNTVSETLQLTTLPPEIKDEYRTSDIRMVSKSALIELTRIKDTHHQQSVWTAMKQGQWTVRAARKAKTATNPGIPAQDKALGAGRAFLRKIQTIEVIDPTHYQELLALSEALREHLTRLRPPEPREER
ncbi:MAG: ParB/RepB/Spo0J family partition protein [Candidatus Competibacter sp.]